MSPLVVPQITTDTAVTSPVEHEGPSVTGDQATGAGLAQSNPTDKGADSEQKIGSDAKVTQGPTLTGKAAKEKAKAERSARRAQDKQKRGQPILDMRAGNNAEPKKAGKEPTSTSASSANFKGQHKKTGSVSQKSLPIRQTESQAATTGTEHKREGKRVALFDHLYGHPRRTGLAGAARDVHPAVLALGLQMGNYVICGSNARCVATMLVFKQVIESYITPAQNSLPRHLPTHLSSQIDYIVSCRPLSISMGNAIRWLKVAISEVDVSTSEAVAKHDLCTAIDNFISERITVADEVIAASATEKIRDGDVILTYAKSSIVQKTLAQAFRQGKKFRVIVVDSRPLFEGRNHAQALSNLGIDVQYVLITGVDHVIRSATKVFLGAHGMMSNGRLYSRVGTALVAMAAKEVDVPVIVCCESIKFTDRVALDSFVLNEIAPPDELLSQEATSTGMEDWRDVPNLQLLNLMYDLTPADYIDMIITEYGSLPPSSVPVVHRLSTNT